MDKLQRMSLRTVITVAFLSAANTCMGSQMEENLGERANSIDRRENRLTMIWKWNSLLRNFAPLECPLPETRDKERGQDRYGALKKEDRTRMKMLYFRLEEGLLEHMEIVGLGGQYAEGDQKLAEVKSTLEQTAGLFRNHIEYSFSEREKSWTDCKIAAGRANGSTQSARGMNLSPSRLASQFENFSGFSFAILEEFGTKIHESVKEVTDRANKIAEEIEGIIESVGNGDASEAN